jgi:hypothetical protein
MLFGMTGICVAILLSDDSRPFREPIKKVSQKKQRGAKTPNKPERSWQNGDE